MASFDDIGIRRPAIAGSYLGLLSAQPGRPLALFAPRRVGNKRLALEALREGFRRIGFKPGLMRDIVKAMSAEGITDVQNGITHYMNSEQQTAIWRALLGSVDVFDQGVLGIIAQGQPPLSQATLQALASIPGARPTIAKVRASIEKLRRQGLLTRGKGGNSIDDPLFAEYLAAQGAAVRARPSSLSATGAGVASQDTM